MTEDEWLKCSNPQELLAYLKGGGSRRKLRLFAVDCCWRYRHMLVPESLSCLEIAERFAEGQADQVERRHARERAFHAPWNSDNSLAHRRGPAKACVTAALARQAFEAARLAGHYAWNIGLLSKRDWPSDAYRKIERGLALSDWSSGRQEQDVLQTAVIRDIFGNPFRPAIFEPAWLTPTVRKLAQVIYADRAFERMPELATALTEAGCTSQDILTHCLGAGPHVRGCWVIDLLLAKV